MCEVANINQVSWAWVGRRSSPVVEKQTPIYCFGVVETFV
jgi:hypothetical protein